MGVLPKDHKQTQENGDPVTRPVCYAKHTLNGEMSEFTSSALDPAAKALEGKEVISTEETAHLLDRLNNKLEKGEVPVYTGLVAGSLDVKALYPSLEIDTCCRLGAERVIESGVRFEAFNHEWGAIYIALTTTQEQLYKERLTHLIPFPKARNATGKNRPTIVSIDKDIKTPRWKWPKKKEDYTERDKQVILQKVP